MVCRFESDTNFSTCLCPHSYQIHLIIHLPLWVALVQRDQPHPSEDSSTCTKKTTRCLSTSMSLLYLHKSKQFIKPTNCCPELLMNFVCIFEFYPLWLSGGRTQIPITDVKVTPAGASPNKRTIWWVTLSICLINLCCSTRAAYQPILKCCNFLSQ